METTAISIRGALAILLCGKNISSTIRLIARLLKELRVLMKNKEVSLFEAIHPLQYENFIIVVFWVCGEEQIVQLATNNDETMLQLHMLIEDGAPEKKMAF